MAKKQIPTPAATTDAAAAEAAPVTKKSKKAAKPSPAPEPTPAEPTKAATGRFAGRGTMAAHGIPAGLRRNAFQDALLAWNETKDGHRSDEELAAIMDAEHPEGGVRIAARVGLVRVIRRFYNEGKHGKQQAGAPAVPSQQWVDGKPVAATKKASAA